MQILSAALILLVCNSVFQLPAERRARELQAALAKKVTNDREVNATLAEVLESLSDRHDLTMLIDVAAFKKRGLEDVEKAVVKFKAQKDVEVRRVLQELLTQVSGTFILRRDYIEIIPNVEPKQLTWAVGEQKRAAVVYENAGTEPESGAPLLLVFHGHGGTAEGIARKLDVHKIWPEAVVVYMQGLPGVKGLADPDAKQAAWQKDPGELNDRDVRFIDKALEELQRAYKIDPKRVYAMGHSNGARFTAVLWKMRPDKFAAFCCCAGQGGIMIGSCEAKPVFMIAGEKDQWVPLAGQQLSMAIARKLLKTDSLKAKTEGHAKTEPGINGTELVTYIHPGGHEFPKETVPLVVKFFQRHEKK